MNTQLVAPQETQVITALQAVKKSGEDYAIKAVIAGLILIEYKAALPPQSHSETTGKFAVKKEDARVDALFDKAGVSRPTGYRYMRMAERVSRLQMGWSITHDFKPVIDVPGADSIPMSRALVAANEKHLPAAAQKFRQDVFDFMADHTLGEAAQAVLDGESPDKRITLAAGGKKTGGKGNGDRKAFERFVAQKLQHITTAVVAVNQKKGSKTKTYKDRNLAPTQKGLIVAAFVGAMKLWPRWLVDAVHDAAKTEAKLSEIDRAQNRTKEQS